VTTDPDGKFAFELRAAWFRAEFRKAGYTETNLDFEWIGFDSRDDTNQNLRVFLSTKGS
jgi:hypothetical protein